MAKLKNKEFYTPLFFKAYAIIKLSRAVFVKLTASLRN